MAATKLQAAWRGKLARNQVAFKRRMKAAASRMSAIEGMDDLLAGLLDEEGEEDEAQEEAEEEEVEGVEEEGEEAGEDAVEEPEDALDAALDGLVQDKVPKVVTEEGKVPPIAGEPLVHEADPGQQEDLPPDKVQTEAGHGGQDHAEPEADAPAEEKKKRRRKKKIPEAGYRMGYGVDMCCSVILLPGTRVFVNLEVCSDDFEDSVVRCGRFEQCLNTDLRGVTSGRTQMQSMVGQPKLRWILCLPRLLNQQLQKRLLKKLWQVRGWQAPSCQIKLWRKI